MMSDLVGCPRCGSDQIAEIGHKQPILIEDITLSPEKEDEVLTDLFDSDNRDRQCLACGAKWNAEERSLQQQEDQSQLDALTFGDRKEKFYADYESGRADHARQNVPVEAISIYKRKGLKSAYKFLKLLDLKINRFKRRTLLVSVGVLLVLLLVLYAVM